MKRGWRRTGNGGFSGKRLMCCVSGDGFNVSLLGLAGRRPVGITHRPTERTSWSFHSYKAAKSDETRQAKAASSPCERLVWSPKSLKNVTLLCGLRFVEDRRVHVDRSAVIRNR